MRAIRRNDVGAAVEDVQKRLRILGYPLAVDGRFLERTQAAVRAFRESEGLPEGDTVDAGVWAALVDATFAMGDRMLFLRIPYFHGHDVRQLQEVLNALGFVAGESDGIFGAHTEHALREFQLSIGLPDDGVAGHSTFEAVERLRHAWEGKSAVNEGTASHMGFARAAQALEALEVCFFGLDAQGREVALRAANLAQATTGFSHVTSADALSVAPPPSTLMLGVGLHEAVKGGGCPVVLLEEGYGLPQRLHTALQSVSLTRPRLLVELPAQGDSRFADATQERWRQHLAVTLLDALCAAQEQTTPRG